MTEMRAPSSAAGAADFELDTLRTEDGRVVVEGHWTGTRGLRFVRPTLVLPDREVLATLEHKPWAPVEGRTWIAAFPYEGPELDRDDVTLAVGSSIAIPLAGETGRARIERASTRERGEERRREAAELKDRRRESEIEFLRSRVARLTAELEERGAAQDDGGAQGAEAADEITRLTAERDEAREAQRVDNVARLRAEVERTHGFDACRQAERERDEGVRYAQEDRDACVRAAEHERDEARREAATAVDAAHRAIPERERARGERDAAIAARDEEHQRAEKARGQRDDALVAYRALDRRGPAPAAAERAGSAACDTDTDTETPLGVVAVPAARDLAPGVHHADRAPLLSHYDVWAVRVLGGIAAFCFVALMLMLLRVFV